MGIGVGVRVGVGGVRVIRPIANPIPATTRLKATAEARMYNRSDLMCGIWVCCETLLQTAGVNSAGL